MKKQSLAEVQETAGFEEPQPRAALGGLFNMIFFISILDSTAGTKEPVGGLAEAISKQFTDYNSFKEAFKKAVQSRFSPGWVWLGVKDGKLTIQQTNNHDNPLMMGVVEQNSTPVIALCCWEHAYWEEHDGSKDSSYLEEFWNTIDWEKVSANFEQHNLKG